MSKRTRSPECAKEFRRFRVDHVVLQAVRVIQMRLREHETACERQRDQENKRTTVGR